MSASVIRYLLQTVAIFPFVYYMIAIFSAWRFFGFKSAREADHRTFTPPVSILKPLHGVDPEPFENFASFCRQDYPDYEIVFCVDDRTSPLLPVIDRLCREFPERRIRTIYGSGFDVANDKVGKLARLVLEAEHEVLVISDSDVRVAPEYLRTLVSPLAYERVAAVTCFYVPVQETGIIDRLQSIGMFSDFYVGILVAKCLDGVKFALGPSIATTRTHLARFGGYKAIANRPADDMLVGRLIAEQGLKVELLRYSVQTVADYHSFGDLFRKRLRWITVMRHMRPWGHLGLIFTLGLPWSIAAIALHPTAAGACGYLFAYGAFRLLLTWQVGIAGLRQKTLWKDLPLIPVWDALAFVIWLLSFASKTIRWRGADYRLQNGELVPVRQDLYPTEKASTAE